MVEHFITALGYCFFYELIYQQSVFRMDTRQPTMFSSHAHYLKKFRIIDHHNARHNHEHFKTCHPFIADQNLRIGQSLFVERRDNHMGSDIDAGFVSPAMPIIEAGCNAAAIVATRVIDSPRERLIAIITNNFALCNGRWPTQILVATIFIGGLVPAHLAGLVSAAAVVSVAVLGIVMTFFVSWALSRTVLKGEASAFSLEMPPYRPPQILRTIYTSMIDRTMIVLWRAVIFAIPAGAAIWLMSNLHVGGTSLAVHFIDFTGPFGALVGLNGVILLAYVIAIPANEIVIPTILMLTVLSARIAGLGDGAGVMFEPDSDVTADVLLAGGWTLLTAVNLMLFSLVHNPCSTTIYTIYKETRSAKWTTVSALLPVAMGFIMCFVLTQVWLLLS